jgi:uncharacterized protein YjlB
VSTGGLELWHAPPGDHIPNHPSFPVLVYRAVAGVTEGTAAARGLLAAHGWGGSWVDGVFGFHHFHSTSHEVLAVVAGEARLELGGPQGETFAVDAGDVLVLPAGTGHRSAWASTGFTVVGAYPEGQEEFDVLRGEDPREVAEARVRIAALARPSRDPVGGPGIAHWT